MQVPMYNHTARFAALQNDLEAALRRVLLSGKPDWGPEVPALEAEFAKWVGIAHAVGCNSGTAALRLALLALGIGAGDEVITAPNTDAGTVSAIHHVGAKPVFVDVEPDTLNLDPKGLSEAITPRTKAIMVVHLYGHPANMLPIEAFARQRGLFLIEDACLALGASVRGRPVGLWGDIACFSFASTKHLGGFGSGGICVTKDPELYERLLGYVGYGQPRARVYDPKASGQDLHYVGVNERLDELQAAMLRVQLPYLQSWIQARQQHAAAYTQALAQTSFEPPAVRQGYVHTFRNYVMQTDNRDQVQQRLAQAGVATTLAYVPPIHLQPAYAFLHLPKGSFPVTERSAQRLLCLPVSPQLSVEQRNYVIEQLLAIGGQA